MLIINCNVVTLWLLFFWLNCVNKKPRGNARDQTLVNFKTCDPYALCYITLEDFPSFTYVGQNVRMVSNECAVSSATFFCSCQLPDVAYTLA